MVFIGVCEDQSAERKNICCYIEHYAEINHCTFEIADFESGQDFWAAYQPGKFNLLFLDIYLEDTTGIAMAKKIRELGDDCALVFITSSRDHAIEGFELRAQHYLIKPVTEEQLFEALNRCTQAIKGDMKYLSIPSGKLERRVLLKDIVYIEVFDKVSVLHTPTEEIKTYVPLSQLEKQLGGAPFLRCHRCSIVNMNHIEDYTSSDFVMNDGNQVAIRRSSSVAIRQQYLDFVFAKLRGEHDGN